MCPYLSTQGGNPFTMLAKSIFLVSAATAYQLRGQSAVVSDTKGVSKPRAHHLNNCHKHNEAVACGGQGGCRWFAGERFPCQVNCEAHWNDKHCQTHSNDKNCNKEGCAAIPGNYCFPVETDPDGQWTCMNARAAPCPEGTDIKNSMDRLNPTCQGKAQNVVKGAECFEAMLERVDDDLSGARTKCTTLPLSKTCAWKKPVNTEHWITGTSPQSYCVPRSTSCEENLKEDHCQQESQYCEWFRYSLGGKTGSRKLKEADCKKKYGDDVCAFDHDLNDYGACLPKGPTGTCTCTDKRVFTGTKRYNCKDEDKCTPDFFEGQFTPDE